MRPTRAYGRPATPVVPADWDTSHAAVLDRTHPATITITLPGEPTWDPELRRTTRSVTTLYAGPASLTQADATDVDAGDAHQLAHTYDVVLPHDVAGITEKARVHVDTCPGDPDLAGADLAVDSVASGTRRFARHLRATLT